MEEVFSRPGVERAVLVGLNADCFTQALRQCFALCSR